MKKDMYPDIVKRFRQMGDMTPDQLAQVLAMLKDTLPGPGVTAPAPAADNHNTTGNEEDEQK